MQPGNQVRRGTPVYWSIGSHPFDFGQSSQHRLYSPSLVRDNTRVGTSPVDVFARWTDVDLTKRVKLSCSCSCNFTSALALETSSKPSPNRHRLHPHPGTFLVIDMGCVTGRPR